MATAAPVISVEEYLSEVYEPDCDYVDGHLEERNWVNWITADYNFVSEPSCYRAMEAVALKCSPSCASRFNPGGFGFRISV